jgi:hypothetical protein
MRPRSIVCFQGKFLNDLSRARAQEGVNPGSHRFLRKADPPLSETLIEQELLALEEAIKRIEAEAELADANQQHRRFAFWGFLILSIVWICDLFYEPLTFSGWYDWLRLGGFIFFPTVAILSYFIMRENWSAEQKKRAYIVFTPIILVGAVLLSVVVHFAFGRLGATPS